MNIQELAKPAVRALVAGGACLALIAPSAGARPIAEPTVRAAAPAAASPAPQLLRVMRDDRGALDRAATSRQPASGNVDWITAVLVGAAFAGVLGLIWLAAATISRFTRTRVAE